MIRPVSVATRHRLAVLAGLAAITAALTIAPASPAHPGAAAAGWLWSPGLCKSRLQNYGVRISDGRTFSVQKAFCIGYGGRQFCQWNSSYTARLYSRFYAIMRSYDGVVRTMNLTPVSRDNFRGSNLVVRFRYMDADKFAAYNTVISTVFAKAELEKGCGP
jgi:hypothetical protein